MGKSKSAKIEGLIRFMGFLVLIFLFGVLLLRYYFPAYLKMNREDSRFVEVDYQSLENEASSLKVYSPEGSENENAKNVFVLTYHKITNGPPTGNYEISYDQFKADMFALKENGYETISLNDLYLYMQGKKELPDKSFLLTFDDGTRLAYYNGDPVLKALNYTAVMFVIAGHINTTGPYYLNTPELEDVKNTSRWEIESHTYETHTSLPIDENGSVAPALTNKIWLSNESRLETDEEYYSRVSRDLVDSKYILEDAVGAKVTGFALPYGDFGERNSNYADANNVLVGLTTSDFDLVFYEFPLKFRSYRGNYYGSTNDTQSFLISRLPADMLRDPDSLLKRIEASRAIDLPYYEDYQIEDRWIRPTGTATYNNDSIELNPEPAKASYVLAYLDGSYLWKDYAYSVRVKNMEASQVNLLARYAAPDDYVECRYQDNTASVVNVKGDFPQATIDKEKIPENKTLSEGDIISMYVYEDYVACFLNGQRVAGAKVPGMPLQGGVGIRADRFYDLSKSFAFDEISVTTISDPSLIFSDLLNSNNESIMDLQNATSIISQNETSIISQNVTIGSQNETIISSQNVTIGSQNETSVK